MQGGSRYASYTHDRLRAIEDALRYHFPERELPVQYNIAPSQQVLVVRRSRTNGYEVAEMKWGLVPYWAKESKVGYSTINASSENVARSATFRDAFKHRRCLVPADAFYEWQKVFGMKAKQPYAIRMADGSPFAFAGLWERWGREDQCLETCTIMTTDANEVMVPIHNRMPVILDPKDYAAWMAKDNDNPGELLKPSPAERMHTYRISTRVNRPENESPECLEALSG